jgi:ATP-dependent helicase/DNAse subunit B
MTTGTFIHKILEEIVKKNLKNIGEIENLSKKIHLEEFKDSNLDEAMPLIKVFFERNKERYNENSIAEEILSIHIDGIKFTGKADRIDISDTGEITIVDYKTGKSDIKPKYRNWQLGLYALAAKKLGNPRTLILDMLQKDHALEFQIDNMDIAKEIHSSRTYFSIPKVKKELLETAREIINARRNGFKSCPIEKGCAFCEEWIYKK